MTSLEQWIAPLNLISALSGILALALILATAMLAMKTTPKQMRQEIVDQTPPPPEPEVPKRRVIRSFVPEDIQAQLELLLGPMQSGSAEGWDSSTVRRQHSG